MEFPSLAQILQLHKRLIETSGGSHGIRDRGGLESALNAAQNRRFYESATLPECAATFAYHLTNAHAFIDGNKRIAAATAEIFLQLNGAQLDVGDEEFLALILRIATGEINRTEVDNFFHEYTRTA